MSTPNRYTQPKAYQRGDRSGFLAPQDTEKLDQRLSKLEKDPSAALGTPGPPGTPGRDGIDGGGGAVRFTGQWNAQSQYGPGDIVWVPENTGGDLDDIYIQRYFIATSAPAVGASPDGEGGVISGAWSYAFETDGPYRQAFVTESLRALGVSFDGSFVTSGPFRTVSFGEADPNELVVSDATNLLSALNVDAFILSNLWNAFFDYRRTSDQRIQYLEGLYDDLKDRVADLEARQVPPVPTMVAAVTDGTTIVVSWDGDPVATGYRVYQGGTVVRQTSEYSVSIPDDGTNSTNPFSVSAYSNGGESAQSAGVIASGGSGIPPTPRSLTAQQLTGPNQVGLTWLVSAGATRYLVYRDGLLAKQVLAPDDDRNVLTTIDQVSGPGTYSYRVAAANDAGTSAQSNTATVTLSA